MVKPVEYVKFLDTSQRSIVARFRSGSRSMRLRVEKGQYRNIPLMHRTCEFCTAVNVEDEYNFLMECDLYTDYRTELLQKFSANHDFMAMSKIK